MSNQIFRASFYVSARKGLYVWVWLINLKDPIIQWNKEKLLNPLFHQLHTKEHVFGEAFAKNIRYYELTWKIKFSKEGRFVVIFCDVD